MIFEMGILSTRKVGFLLAAVWIGTLSYIWLPDLIQFATKSKPHSNEELSVRFTTLKNVTDHGKGQVHVCLTSDKNTIGGMVTVMNSILSNTKSPVKFHLVTDKESEDHLNLWLMTSKLKNASFEIKVFPREWVENKIRIRGGRKELGSALNYARYYLPKLFPDLKQRIVFVDDDCIVQGDIKELYDTPIQAGHLAAFSQDCVGVNKRLSRLQNVYAEFLDFKNEHIKKLHMKPTACSFNTGVFVSDLTHWDKLNITNQLEYWMALNTQEEVYGNEKGGGGSQPPMMIVFYDKYSPLDPMWHVRYLGWTSGSSYSRDFVRKAKLLHWNGKFKPWGRGSQHSELWDKYFLPDPRGKFIPVRRGSTSKGRTLKTDWIE